MMRRIRAVLIRIAALCRASRRDDDFAAELDSHLQLHVDDNVRAGMTADQARRDALVKLGGVAHTREQYRDRLRLPMVDALWFDVRQAVRVLAKRPVLLATATLSIGFGAGVNISVYAVLHRVLFESIVSAPDPDRLARLAPGISYSNYADLRRVELPLDLATMTMTPMIWREAGAPTAIHAHVVSENFFDVVRATPRLGQLFHGGTSGGGHSAAPVVLTFGFWRQRLGGDASVVGSIINLNDDPYEVIGVLPEDFRSMALASPNVYVLTSPRVLPALQNRRAAYFDAIARLHEGVTIEQATAALRAAAASLEASFPADNRGLPRALRFVAPTGLAVLNEIPGARAPAFVAIVYALVGLVLLITCANVAGLLVARADERRHEIAVRTALGASRGRLAQQFLAESFVIAVSGSIAGAALWHWSASIVRSLPSVVNAGISAVPGSAPLAYAAALACVATLACGAAPAWTAAQAGVPSGLQRRGEGLRFRRFTLQRAIVGAEVAICFVLLSAAVVLLFAFREGRSSSRGFDAGRVVAVDVRMAGAASVRDFFALRNIARAVPGVERVSSDQGVVPPIAILDHVRYPGAAAGAPLSTAIVRVGPDFFRTMGISLARGRDFVAGDYSRGNSDVPVVVNQTFARRYFANLDPIDRRLVLPAEIEAGHDERIAHIVGVAADTQATGINHDVVPVLYTPAASTFLLVRVAGPATSAARTIEHTIATRVPGAAVSATPAADRFDMALLPMKVGGLLMTTLAAVAVLLAMTGLYGVVSYTASRRAFEVGVRIALGATRHAIMRLMIGDALAVVAFGCAAGALGAVVVATALRTILGAPRFAFHLVLCAIVPVVLFTITIFASVWPARRAARVNPAAALRHE